MLLSEIDEYSVKILVSIGVNARSKFNSYNRLEIGRLPDHLNFTNPRPPQLSNHSILQHFKFGSFDISLDGADGVSNHLK